MRFSERPDKYGEKIVHLERNRSSREAKKGVVRNSSQDCNFHRMVLLL